MFRPPEDCQLGEVGRILSATIMDGEDPADLSEASAATILVQKPDGTAETFTAEAGDDGQVSYTTEAGDLDQVGRWQVQGRAIGPGSPVEYDRYSEVTGFTVYPNVGEP